MALVLLGCPRELLCPFKWDASIVWRTMCTTRVPVSPTFTSPDWPSWWELSAPDVNPQAGRSIGCHLSLGFFLQGEQDIVDEVVAVVPRVPRGSLPHEIDRELPGGHLELGNVVEPVGE